MNDENFFTAQQLTFLQLLHIAAKYDCLYIIDFYCMDEFDHDQTSILSDDERAILTARAEREIFAHAIENGYRPRRFSSEVSNDFLC